MTNTDFENICKLQNSISKFDLNKELNKLFELEKKTETKILLDKKIKSINVTKFINIIRNDANFINMTKSLSKKIKISRLGNFNPRPKWIMKEKIWSLYGQFIDYLIRHFIANKCNMSKSDDRAHNVLYNIIYEDKKKIEIQDELLKSYNKFTTMKTEEIIDDIFNVSICHSIFFGNNKDMTYINNKNEKISDKMWDDIVKYFNDNKLKNKKIYLNPNLSLKYIRLLGDADIIIDDELIDIKTSTKMYNIDDFYQLIIYASMYLFNTGNKINKITIYNPIRNIEISINISDWENEKNIIQLFESYFKLNMNDEISYLNNMYKLRNDYLDYYLTKLNKIGNNITYVNTTLNKIEKNDVHVKITLYNVLKILENKNVLIFDTETTGLPYNKKEFVFRGRKEYYDYNENDKYDSSRIVQIGWIYINNLNWKCLDKYNINEHIRKPEDFYSIPIEAYNIHGINYEKARKEGIKLIDIINKHGLYDAIINCDYIIAHKAYFDVMILLNELYRLKSFDLIKKINNLDEKGHIICTGQLFKEKFKKGKAIPRLPDVYKYYCKESIKKWHSAGYDTEMIIKILLSYAKENMEKISNVLTNSDNDLINSDNDLIEEMLDDGLYAYEGGVMKCNKCNINYNIYGINAGCGDYEDVNCTKCKSHIGKIRCDLGNPIIKII